MSPLPVFLVLLQRPIASVAPTAPPPEDAGVVWRRDFPLLAVARPALVYLDSAATTHKPASVVAAMTEFYTRHYATVHRGVYRVQGLSDDGGNPSLNRSGWGGGPAKAIPQTATPSRWNQIKLRQTQLDPAQNFRHKAWRFSNRF